MENLREIFRHQIHESMNRDIQISQRYKYTNQAKITTRTFMQKSLLTTPYLSGFQIFLPHLPFPHSHILFPTSPPPSLNPFLIKLLILHFHNLPYLSSHYNWNIKTLNLIRMVLGLYYEDFSLVEASLEEMLLEPNAMDLFYYIYLYLTDGVKEKRTLNEKRGFYKIILYWVMRKFNEYITKYNKENITEKVPVIPVLKGEFSQKEGSEIEMVGYLQSGYKELKDIIKREGHKEKIGWRVSLQGIRLEPIELGFKRKSPIELLLEGNMSAILEILRVKNYTLEKVQEEIRASCLYLLAKGHFSLEFSVFLMEQSGLEVDQVLADYYCFTLRKDIRKKIAKYFKEKGAIEDSLISPFIAFQEIFAPIDSITIALRRKYAMSKVVGPMKRLKNLNNIWRGDSSKKEEFKGKPKDLMDLVEKASSYGHFTFEMDDLEEDEPGAAYMRREYEMTRYYRGEREEEDEKYGHRGVFSVEEFRKNDRRMYEVNMKMSFKGKDKFKPRASGKKKSQDKLERYCQQIFKGYLGRGMKLPARIFEMERRVKEPGYFQYKMKDVEEIDSKNMLAVLFERLKLNTEEILQIFGGLEKDQKEKYFQFLMEYLVERRDWKSIEDVLGWIMEKEEALFKEYFGIGEERIVMKLTECLSHKENMRRLMEIMVKKGYSVSEEVIGIKEMIGLLARNRMIMRGEMKGIVRYLGENKLKFVVVSLLKGGCEVNIERFLEESGIKIPEEKAVILSIKGDEKAFGGVISLWEEEAGGLSVKSKDLYWEYKICGRKCGVGALGEKKEIPVFEVFRAGSLASYFLIGQISNTEDMSLANTKLAIEDRIEFDGVKELENKALEVRTISLMVQLGLPFAGFLSIFSDHSIKRLLLGEREVAKSADLETLTRDLAILNEGNKDMKTVCTILRICFKAMLQNPFNLDLFRSYLAFLKLLKLDPEPFLVNCLVYRRIFIFLGCKEKTPAELFKLYYYSENFLQAPKELFVEFYNPLKSSQQQNQWVEEENKARVPERLEKMSGYFLEVYSQNIRGYGTQKGYNKRGTHLIEILEQLEEATISMESIMEVMKGEKEIIKEMESPWGLVSKFCTLHNIPSSLKLLEEISAKNDWLKLLLELDVQKCSIETAKEFINKYFHHIVLKKHLINSLEDEKVPAKNREEWMEENILKDIKGIRMDDKGIIGVILKIREILKKYEGGQERVRKILGKGLVRLSEEINMEILCLMAEFVDEGEKEERYFKHLGIGRRRLQGEVLEIKGEERWRKELGDLVYWCQKDMKELVKITRVYFGERSWVEFIEGIEKIFEGNVIEMKEKFAIFVKEYKEERKVDKGSIFLEARFIEMFVKNLIYHEIFTEEQAVGVLEALCKIRLSKQMEDWYINLGVLRKMPKRIRTKGLIFNSFKIYLLLLEAEMFEEAKVFSTRYGFSKSYLALIQTQKLLVSGLKSEGDHKGLIDQILVMLLKSEAKIYQTAYYMKYLTMKNEGLSLWDHIYLLNIAYRLMEKMTGEENEKFREKVRIQRDLLLYGNYWKDLRRYWFRNKERGHEKVLLEVRGRWFMKNVKVSDELEGLVVNNFLCGLSNFDCEYVERICERYGVMLLDNEIYAFWRDIEDTLSGLVVKNIGLFEVLGLFGMGVGKVKIQQGEEFEEEMKKEKLKEMAQGYLRVRNEILIKENRENFEEYMKGYLYYCRLMKLCKGDFATFGFVGLKEMSEFLQDLTLKKVFELLMTSPEEQRQEILAIISWTIEHNKVTHDELLSQYFDYSLEALCNYKPESLSFLERLNKTKRYDRTIENIQSFSRILALNHELQQTAGRICLNYLKNNEAPRYTQCILLILAYFLISQDPKPLLNRLLGVSMQFILKIVHDIGTRGGQKSHQEIWLDQVCLMVLGFEWHPCVLLGLSEALSKQKGLWKSLYGNFGKRWGYKFVEKMVMVGHSLPPLEAELLDQPVILGNLCYVRAKKHLEALVGDGKRSCLLEKIEEIGDKKDVVVKDLSLIGEHLLCSHKYFMMARKSGLARKALNQLALIYKVMNSVQKNSF